MSSYTLAEGLLGIMHKNVHVLRDFFNFLLLLVSLGYSVVAIDMSQEEKEETDLEAGPTAKKDGKYRYGLRRLNLLAAFFNCIYLMFMFVFDTMETLHHTLESLEKEGKHMEVYKSEADYSEHMA